MAASAKRTTTPVPLPLDPYAAQHAGLVEVHHALVGSLHATVAAASAASKLEVAVGQAIATGRFLRGHHEAESTVLFPGLRRLGRLRSSDAAFLDTCDSAHRELHALSDRLVAAASSPHPVAIEIATLARRTVTVLSAHVLQEEAGLAPERLRQMISVEGLLEIGRELDSLRRR